jgi:rod shape-determining protein MreD
MRKFTSTPKYQGQASNRLERKPLTLRFIIIALIFLAIMLQISFFPNIMAPGIFPDIALIAIIFWSARSGFEKTWPWAVIGGLMLDLAYFWPIGANILTLALAAYGASYLSRRFLVMDNFSRFFTMAGIIILGGISYNILTPVIVRIARHEFFGLGALVLNADLVLKMAYDLAILAVIYKPLIRLEKFLEFYATRTRLSI